ncbi:MAG: GIY-YIG nuclease family protein [Flavobacteriales bacterium]|nr:GIY-YIG nuclease family protein [Flavobacteriales bacterium]MCB9178580.1 GIY-YIG nuclease family protein [Flavobacteriales bacterium]
MDLPFHVYILLCADGHYYVGCTSSLSQRLARHDSGGVYYTRSRLPVQCVAAFGFADKYKAYDFEKYLKTGSGRAFMGRHLV